MWHHIWFPNYIYMGHMGCLILLQLQLLVSYLHQKVGIKSMRIWIKLIDLDINFPVGNASLKEGATIIRGFRIPIDTKG
jgi:hypothetical protein